jgi:outer membrane receptor protein involved in Fe transport
MVDIESVERIEVYRGSASALYGSDAIGGVVNIVTGPGADSAGESNIGGSVKLLGRSADEQVYARLDMHGSLGRADLDLGLSSRSVGTLHTPEGEIPNTDFTDYSGNLTLDIPFNQMHSIRTSLQHYRARDIGIPVFNDELESSGRYPLKERGSAELSYQVRPTALLPWISNATASAWAQKIHSKFKENTVDSLFFRNIHIGWIMGDRKSDSELISYGTRLESTALPSENLFATFGIEVLREDVEGLSITQETQMDIDWDVVSVEDDSIASLPDARRITISAFAQSELDLWSRAVLSLGIRHDEASTETWETTGSTVDPGKTSANRTSVKVGSRVKVTDDLTLTGSLGSGFKVPTLQELYFNDIVHGGMWVFGNDTLIVEDALSADAGIRFANSRVSVVANAFRTWTDDLITVRYVGMLYNIPRFQYVNVTKAVIEGVEVEADWRPTRQLQIGGAWSWLRGDDVSEHGFGQPEEIPLPSMPPSKTTVDLNYTPPVTLGPFSEFWMELKVRIVADQTRVAPEEEKSKGFTLWDIRFGCDVGKWSDITFGVENVANKSYQQPLSMVREAGRNFSMAWRMKF